MLRWKLRMLFDFAFLFMYQVIQVIVNIGFSSIQLIQCRMHIDFNFEIMKLKSLRTTDVLHILEILKTLYNDNTIFHSIRVQHLALRLDFLWAHFPKIPKVLPGGFARFAKSISYMAFKKSFCTIFCCILIMGKNKSFIYNIET